MFNIEAFKDFINCLGNVTSDNDMKKKIEFINNMLDDETVVRCLKDDWIKAEEDFFVVLNALQDSTFCIMQFEIQNNLFLSGFKIAGFSLQSWLNEVGYDNRLQLVKHIRAIYCKNINRMKYPSEYEADLEEEGGELNLENALSDLQNSGAMQKVLSGAEKMAKDIQNGKKLDINNLLGEVMSGMSNLQTSK